MNNLTFDLISDLYLEPGQSFDWTDRATSLFCVVAGNISHDRQTLYNTLEHLSNFYESIFYIDGMLEHSNYNCPDVDTYDEISQVIEEMDKVYFLHDNIVVINGVGILATNGWCTFNFDEQTSIDTIEFLRNSGKMDEIKIGSAASQAVSDTEYFINSIKSCQTMPDIQKIVCVSNAVPIPQLVTHDETLEVEFELNCMGNLGISNCITEDSEEKINTWCFGRYHGDMDVDINGIRFVNNTACDKDRNIYHPKRIKV